MTKEQTKPQFIYLVNGVFRPAKLRMPKNSFGYALGRNVELGQQEISPDALNLVSSSYLGPINIFEEQLGDLVSEGNFQRLEKHKHRTVCRIVEMAEISAEEQGVPYFGVNIVHTDNKFRTWIFTAEDIFGEMLPKKDTYLSLSKKEHPSLLEKEYSLVNILSEVKKPLEFVLHPTAQLYVLRK